MGFYSGAYLNLGMYSNKYLTAGFYQQAGRGYILPPCFDDYGIFFYDIEQKPIVEVDGQSILVDLKGESGSEVGREYRGGAYLDGNGSRYVNVYNEDGSNAIVFPSSDDFELKLQMSYTHALLSIVVGQYITSTEGRFYLGTDSGGEIRLFCGGTNGFLLKTDNSYNDGEMHDMKLTRIGNTFTLYVEEEVKSITSDFDILQSITTILGGDSGVVSEPCSINKVELVNIANFTFEEGNADNRCEDISGNGHYGLIQNSTGDDRVSTDALESVQDKQGYSVAIRNEVDNYDFSDGTSEWLGIGLASFSVVNQEAICLANSQGDRVAQTYTADAGDELTLISTVKSTSNLVQLRYGGSLLVSHSGSGDYEELYANVTSIGASDIRITDFRTSGYDEFYVQGDIENSGGVFILNRTKIDEAKGTNYASMTAEEINAIKYDLLAMQRYYDENLENVVPTGKYSTTLADGYSASWYVDDGN